jgi:lactoylglutathione lyase
MAEKDALSAIRGMDYVVLFVRDMAPMKKFYTEVLHFPVYRELFDGGWVEFNVGSTLLALSRRNGLFPDAPPAPGNACIQFAFRVAPSEVGKCAEALTAQGIELVHPVTDQPFGHRTLFFRDPESNIIEIYADI